MYVRHTAGDAIFKRSCRLSGYRTQIRLRNRKTVSCTNLRLPSDSNNRTCYTLHLAVDTELRTISIRTSMKCKSRLISLRWSKRQALATIHARCVDAPRREFVLFAGPMAPLIFRATLSARVCDMGAVNIAFALRRPRRPDLHPSRGRPSTA